MSTIIERSTSKHSRTPRILCVDDDPGIQTAIELRMRQYDVEIERAFYGMQGIVEAVETHPDLILMDLAMPNGDGQYLLECVKRNSETASIPVIVLTGRESPDAEIAAAGLHVSAYLKKGTTSGPALVVWLAAVSEARNQCSRCLPSGRPSASHGRWASSSIRLCRSSLMRLVLDAGWKGSRVSVAGGNARAGG